MDEKNLPTLQRTPALGPLGPAQPYRYPDHRDQIPRMHASDDELNSFEKHAFSFVRRYFGFRCARHPTLDIGVGTGRHICFLLDFSSSLYAIDPDPRRLTIARERASILGYSEVFFVQTDHSYLNDLPRPFDFVNCSHVLQHVSARVQHELIAKIKKVLSKDGIAMIILPISNQRDSDRYIISKVCGNRCNNYIVNEKSFNLYTRYISELTLPTHHMSICYLQKVLDFHQLQILRLEQSQPIRFLAYKGSETYPRALTYRNAALIIGTQS